MIDRPLETTLGFEEASFSIAQQGSGQAIVFLHAGVADKRMYESAHRAYSSDWHTISYDRRGFGKTTSPNVKFSHIDDLLAVLEHLGLATAHLIGCSQGGKIAVSFALAFPERVLSLTLIGAAISGAPQPNGYPIEAARLFDQIEAAEETGDLSLVNLLECQLWLDGPTSKSPRVNSGKRELFLDMNMIALLHDELSLGVEPNAAWPQLSNIGIPTLCLCGDLDLPHLVERTCDIASAIPNSLMFTIPQTAHLPTFEKDDACFDIIAPFLSDCQNRRVHPL